MNRRQFFRSLGGLVATAVVAPQVSLDDVAAFLAPAPRGLTIAQIVAVSYEQVLAHQRRNAHLWAESAFLRELERQGVVARVAPDIVPLRVMYNRNDVVSCI